MLSPASLSLTGVLRTPPSIPCPRARSMTWPAPQGHHLLLVPSKRQSTPQFKGSFQASLASAVLRNDSNSQGRLRRAGGRLQEARPPMWQRRTMTMAGPARLGADDTASYRQHPYGVDVIIPISQARKPGCGMLTYLDPGVEAALKHGNRSSGKRPDGTAYLTGSHIVRLHHRTFLKSRNYRMKHS